VHPASIRSGLQRRRAHEGNFQDRSQELREADIDEQASSLGKRMMLEATETPEIVTREALAGLSSHTPNERLKETESYFWEIPWETYTKNAGNRGPSPTAESRCDPGPDLEDLRQGRTGQRRG
jgi:hypothetical protein